MPPLHLSTIIARTPSSLLGHILSLSSKYGGKGHTVLFTLSSNFPESSDLQVAVDTLTRFNEKTGESSTAKKSNAGSILGCLAESFASTKFKGENLGLNAVSCSIGVFESQSCVPFHSTLLGREQPQVGRWHSFRKKGSENSSEALGNETEQEWEPDWKEVGGSNGVDKKVDWENIWKQSSSNNSSSSSVLLLPEELQDTKLSQIQTILSFSSPHPDTFTNVIADTIPEASSLTLVASPTHFITGRAVTLFFDGKILGEGAVGIAFLNDSGNSSCQTEFMGVKKLSGPMTVTSREGNMINKLDSNNPTRLLITCLEVAGLSPTSSSTSSFKDDELFALGVLSPDGKISRTYRITAGDPSSRGGSISLDALTAPDVGSVVQFLHFPAASSVSFSNSTHAPTVAFLVVPEPTDASSPEGRESTSSQDVVVLENTFLAPSTQGFVFARGPSPWTCSLPGGVIKVQW